MNKIPGLKELLVNQIHTILDGRIDTIRKDIELAKESRDNETKSTAGDKYETGREMVQFEMEKLSSQLNKTIDLKNELSKINPKKKFDSVEFGSLVITKSDNYFISIGIGKIECAKHVFYCISLASPIGRLLHQKKVNNKFTFQGAEMEIVEIF